MDEYIDVKFFLMKLKNGELNLKETFDSLEIYIQTSGYFNGEDVKTAFELGEQNKDNNIESKDNILEQFKNDETIDNFINYIAENGFFTKYDINNFYLAGTKNGNNEKMNSQILKDLCVQSFRQYLITNYN